MVERSVIGAAVVGLAALFAAVSTAAAQTSAPADRSTLDRPAADGGLAARALLRLAQRADAPDCGATAWVCIKLDGTAVRAHWSRENLARDLAEALDARRAQRR